jgi:ATP-dependent exoDNAse (exonuclease V) alpha subunit
MDHAYAMTGHGMQGATVDRIVVAMGGNEYLANQKAFYVAISRAKDEAILVTDNAQRLAERCPCSGYLRQMAV